MKKTDLVLLTLHACGGRPVVGITRLVKLVFLFQAEAPAGGRRAPLGGPFDFVAHRYGPFAPDIYDEIGFLESVGMAEADGNRFAITSKGSRFVEQRLLRDVTEEELDRIERIKSRHGEEDLDDLLRHVYTEYPEFAIRSEILDRVAGRRGLDVMSESKNEC